jgi:hypothetical protein
MDEMGKLVSKKPAGSAPAEFKSLSWRGFGLLMVSAASLCFEINLTRLFSVTQFYHFAFMVVSIALLGFGASGTFLALKKKQSARSEEAWFPFLAAAAGSCMLLSYILVNRLPFDSYSIIVDPVQVAVLLLHYLALASPFFFVGMMISTMLRTFSASSGKVYALNLVGSAAGCLGAILAPSLVGGEGMMALSAGVAALAGVFMAVGHRRRPGRAGKGVIVSSVLNSTVLLTSLVILGIRLFSGSVPAFFRFTLSPYKGISYALQNPDAQVISSEWNGTSRVDVVSSPSLHSVPGLSYRYLETLPSIDGLFIDGDNLNSILTDTSDMGFTDFVPVALAYDLRSHADVLILEPMGGLDIWVALASGADQVTAVEGNALIVSAAQSIYDEENVWLVDASGRSFLQGTQGGFDIIQLPLTDSYHPVSSGAYSLGEDYRYTVEAVADMIDRLKPDGILVITRWLQEDPSEWLRTFTLAVTALEERGGDPDAQIVALRGYNTGSLFIKKSAFTDDELGTVRRFADEKAFDLVVCPSLQASEVNRHNILPEPVYFQTFREFLDATPREAFYRAYLYDVEPPRDDHPFFSHYFKWSQLDDILQDLGSTWQPFGGAGYLVILLILIMSLVLSCLLILLPALVTRISGMRLRKKGIPLYFGLIGLAFMLVEMPLIQDFILFLDQPAYALTAVLFCIFLFSGLGSSVGSRKMRLSTALLLLVGILTAYVFLLPYLVHALLGFSLLIRLVVTVLVIAPIGFLMGIPFPGGLAYVQSSHGSGDDSAVKRWMVAWVWAVNGACSVVASILASLLALSFGFSLTLAAGFVCYLLAWIVVGKRMRFKKGSQAAC